LFLNVDVKANKLHLFTDFREADLLINSRAISLTIPDKVPVLMPKIAALTHYS
jgi:hypothetical protein